MRILLFLLTTLLPLTAQQTLIHQVFDTRTDTKVEVLALFTLPASGYFPVRVVLSNNLKIERSIHLDFESTGSYSSGIHCNSSFDLTAGPGKSVTRDYLVPLAPASPTSYSGQSQLRVNLSGSMGSTANSISSSFISDQPAVLLSESLFTPNASALDVESVSKSSGGYSSNSFAAKFDPKQLPDEWLAFAGYDSILLTDNDWTNIPAGGRNAILSWLRMGGQFIIYTTANATAAELGLPAEAGFGTIEILPIASDLKLEADVTVDRVYSNATTPQQKSVRNDFESSWPLQVHFGLKQFRYGWFVMGLILFAILVGPVNLFVFAKSGQRHKLFITTPIISLAASLVLVILIIAQDGFGGSGMRRILMEVRPDEGINAAFVHQEQFSRTGVLTGSQFVISTPATLTPVTIADSRWARFTDSSGTSGTFNIQPSGGKFSATGDWFQSRSEHGHVLSAVISTRGRIETTDTPGSYLSTFAFPIETLFFLDNEGQWNRAENIETGKRFTPVAVDGSMAKAELLRESNGFAERNKHFLENVMNRRDHFIAITTHAPGIDTLPGIKWKETKTVITGPLAAP